MTPQRRNFLKEEIIRVSAELAAFTNILCQDGCNPQAKWSCCHATFCKVAMDYASEFWGVELATTDNPELPLCGPYGCIAPPHLRPICTANLCDKLAYHPENHDRYFELRDQLSELHFEWEEV